MAFFPHDENMELWHNILTNLLLDHVFHRLRELHNACAQVVGWLWCPGLRGITFPWWNFVFRASSRRRLKEKNFDIWLFLMLIVLYNICSNTFIQNFFLNTKQTNYIACNTAKRLLRVPRDSEMSGTPQGLVFATSPLTPETTTTCSTFSTYNTLHTLYIL